MDEREASIQGFTNGYANSFARIADNVLEHGWVAPSADFGDWMHEAAGAMYLDIYTQCVPS